LGRLRTLLKVNALSTAMYTVVEKRRQKSGKTYYVVYLGTRVVIMTYHRDTAMEYLELNKTMTSVA